MPAFRTLAQALASQDCDAVLLVSPPATHRELAEEALAAGWHVVVEKPVALDYGDAAGASRRPQHGTAAMPSRPRTTASGGSRAR